MTSGPPPASSTSGYAPNVRATAPNRFDDPFSRQYEHASVPYEDIARMTLEPHRQRVIPPNERPDPWAPAAGRPTAGLRYAHAYTDPGSLSTTMPQQSQSFAPPGLTANDRPSLAAPGQRCTAEDWSTRRPGGYQEPTPWPISPQLPQNSSTMASNDPTAARGLYSGWDSSWPPPLLRRSSSENARITQMAGYYGEAPSGSPTHQGKSYPQRRPSNRDEFDGPSQLLDKLAETDLEPKEEDLPQLPITLYAQEQDEILSKVNDRLSQCAFTFVARYQFPIPIEPDKRPVRVPGDREWSEWVYLLKRLATKRRIPSRVLYNGQIKQLITILENSLEMRHAAKHQSRPLKDDRNILQLISSGLQVAKILKDAPAMKYLDGLYVQTEHLIQGRRAPHPSAFGGI